MKITILGSGGVSGIPVWSCNCKVCKSHDKRDRRTRPSIMVESGNKKIIVDIGQDFRIQMLKHKIKKLDEILITHSHLDHISSLTELRELENMKLKIPEPLLKTIDEKIEMITYLKARNPSLKISAFKSHNIGSLSIDSIKVDHKKDFSHREEPCYGFLFKEKNFRFAYIPDFNEILEPEKVENLDLLICDGATVKQKWGHVGIEGGMKLFAKIRPKMMLFTHISHSNLPHKELEKHVRKFGNIGIAYDGMIIIT